MIRHSDLAALTVRQIIFHDVPNNPRGGIGQPTLTDTETTTDARRVGILKKRLTQVFGSGAAFEVEFISSTASPVPPLVRTLTSQALPSKDFIEASRTMAQFLFQKQMGSTSPGLLCVVAITCGARTGVAIMKLEREEGADLHLKRDGSHSAFEMSVLDNLVLTDGTRLFKSALFLTNGARLDCLACDSQSDPMNRSDAAKFLAGISRVSICCRPGDRDAEVVRHFCRFCQSGSPGSCSKASAVRASGVRAELQSNNSLAEKVHPGLRQERAASTI
jgi:hypothetical protein